MSGPQPLNLVFGLSGLIGAVVGIVSVLVALIAIEPVVIPAGAAGVPPRLAGCVAAR